MCPPKKCHPVNATRRHSEFLCAQTDNRPLLLCLHQGAVITPAMDHTMSMQPASMMGPITQQMNHLSLGTTGSVSTHSRAIFFSPH